MFLVIVTTADDLFTCGSEEDGVFKLGRVAPFGVTQWRVGVQDTYITQVFECYEVFSLSQSVQPAPTEG